MSESGLFGKKVFFLHPAPVLLEVALALAGQEFEVYLVQDHLKLKRALPRFPDSIVFINLDAGLEESEWEAYVASIMTSLPTIGIGVLTLNDVPSLREKYLMELQIPCGFIIMKIGIAKATEILVKTLEANEARGRRKFVRAHCPPGSGKVNLDISGMSIDAELADISSVGMSIALPISSEFALGTVLKSISLSVKGVRLIISGIVVAKREGDPPLHIIMFAPGSTDEYRRDKLKDLVFRLNQANMDRLLGTI
ncbi:MAG: PilZ domain-containing protein [Spirochaetaceae bacterium]|nr:PilZ domain-containing protein [Spirochaetaceae bacterium]